MELLTSPFSLSADEESLFEFKFISDKELPIGASVYFPFYMKPFEGFIDGLDDDWLLNSLVAVH